MRSLVKSKLVPLPTYIVAVDPGSKEMGVALITADGKVDFAFTLLSDKPTWGMRLEEIISQLPNYLGLNDRLRCTDFATEVVQNGPLASISGLLLPYFHNAAFTPDHRLVPSEWKSYAKRHGAHSDPIKGVRACREMGVVLDWPIDDNAADAVMLGLTFLEQKRIRLKAKQAKQVG